ncbi:uncharacterized protein LAESUDRAFT_146710 [Laetiporus sulphureus 93-53]|uniref:Uncharacterized protein n=1 Tax=Laetiporus sulphureus 93-53 TaxID=1314785 RepID=A0A165EB95_9APHY|nr:uncharacterized protein LAESUDRAFT_146710 [Laetiporus sulphureus 93-53]KZT06648.1 hypothetical protein LAESUDRAFT_146710 [Laetiporus sulphureus 93-53]
MNAFLQMRPPLSRSTYLPIHRVVRRTEWRTTAGRCSSPVWRQASVGSLRPRDAPEKMNPERNERSCKLLRSISRKEAFWKHTSTCQERKACSQAPQNTRPCPRQPWTAQRLTDSADVPKQEVRSVCSHCVEHQREKVSAVHRSTGPLGVMRELRPSRT